ncbi:MAG: hypothetical protein ABI378_14345 [Chitinophagaceae bacterium]
MTTRVYLSFLMLFVLFHSAIAQQKPNLALLNYTHGIYVNNTLLLNIRGYNITIERAQGNFSKPYFSRMFPRLGLHQGYHAIADSSLGVPTFIIKDVWNGSNYLGIFSQCTFFQIAPDTVLGMSVSGLLNLGIAFEREIFELAKHPDWIPDSLTSHAKPPIIFDFCGRKIELPNICSWRGATALHCSRDGMMNWSIHPSLDEAKKYCEFQEHAYIGSHLFKIEKEEIIPVSFEGTKVSAKKIRYHAKAGTNLLLNTKGSRTLIVYYIATPVRGRFVCAVLSYWTSDRLEKNGLPSLLNEVMRLK